MMNQKDKTISPKMSEMCIAVCGELPTACDYLRQNGIVWIEQFMDAAELGLWLRASRCDMILIYAPLGEGLINTSYSYRKQLHENWVSVPVRMLDEPACHSALVELTTTLRSLAEDIYS